MLSYLKSRVMPIPPKTLAERQLEVVEQGSIDRVNRLQAEADAEAEAALEARLALYRTRQSAANVLVDAYQGEAQAFHGTLHELSAIVERLSHLTRAIDAERAWLSQESRELGDFTGILPHAVTDVFVEARRVLGHAWSQGQQT